MIAFLGYFFAIYFGAIALKLFGVPGFKEISWGWFILAPILAPLLRIIWYIVCFCFYAALGLAVCWYGSKLIIWISNLK